MAPSCPDVVEVAVFARSIGCELLSIQYDQQHFGSWFITVRGKAGTARIVWDGKDRSLILQTPSHENRDEWRDTRIPEEAAEQTLEALERLLVR
jgi:hypothetical protein